MFNIEFVSQCFDCSGYASTARSTILELYKHGHNIKVIHKDFGAKRIKLTNKNRILLELEKASIQPDVRHVHLTPENIPEFNKRDVPLVAYPAWETTKLPYEWIDCLNGADAIISPSEFQKKVSVECGVTTPIYVLGYFVDTDIFTPRKIDKGYDAFSFYSIFHWNERKNPFGLLKAYWIAMEGIGDVELILKTYISDPCDISDVKAKIISFKEELGLKYYPKIKIVFGDLSDEDIVGLHNTYDCYLSLSRSEGFGMPIVEAMSCGKPVIATNFYGSCDYLTYDNSYPVGYDMVKVNIGNGFWYREDQMWAEPNIEDAIRCIRSAYNNRYESKQKGLMGRQTVVDKYSSDVFVRKYISVLDTIVN